MDNEKIVPYKTFTGLEIGKNYRPPKGRDMCLDTIDIYDQDMIQMAYISDGQQFRLEKLVLLGCVAFALFFVLIMIFLGSQ